MKLYFLVEGQSSEMIVYPEWVGSLLPHIPIFTNFNDFYNTNEGIYFISGYGYPSILNHISNAISDINQIGNIDYFYVIVDSDEETISDRETEVSDYINRTSLVNTESVIIVQNRCFETMLLGNVRVMPRYPTTEPLISYRNYYDVIPS